MSVIEWNCVWKETVPVQPASHSDESVATYLWIDSLQSSAFWDIEDGGSLLSFKFYFGYGCLGTSNARVSAPIEVFTFVNTEVCRFSSCGLLWWWWMEKKPQKQIWIPRVSFWRSIRWVSPFFRVTVEGMSSSIEKLQVFPWYLGFVTRSF